MSNCANYAWYICHWKLNKLQLTGHFISSNLYTDIHVLNGNNVTKLINHGIIHSNMPLHFYHALIMKARLIIRADQDFDMVEMLLTCTRCLNSFPIKYFNLKYDVTYRRLLIFFLKGFLLIHLMGAEGTTG